MVGVVYHGSYSNKVLRQGDSIHDGTHAHLSREKKINIENRGKTGLS